MNAAAIREYEDGVVEVRHKDKPLPFRVFFDKKTATGAIVAAYLLDKSGGDFLKTF